MIDAIACAEDSFAVECTGSPRQAEPRIEVSVIGIVECRIPRAGRSIYGTGTRGKVERTLSQANTVKFIEIENRGPVRRFVRHTIVFPTQTSSESEGGGYLPFVLKIRHIEHAPQSMTAPGSVVVNLGNRCVSHVRFATKGERVIGSLSLIEAHATDLHTRL